jgi:hypothetical protein
MGHKHRVWVENIARPYTGWQGCRADPKGHWPPNRDQLARRHGLVSQRCVELGEKGRTG